LFGRLCVAFLALSCVSYALPFVLFIVLCCCLPCFFNMRGGRILSYRRSFIINPRSRSFGRGGSDHDASIRGGGAAASTIAAIPTARFHLELDHNIIDCRSGGDAEGDDSGTSAIRTSGGFIEPSDLKHGPRLIQAEDAVCSAVPVTWTWR
jgi:hypothetical protein